MRELTILSGYEDCYKVISKKYKKGKLIKTDIYKTDLRNFFCSCKGFWYTHNCIHLKTIIHLLQSKGIGIFWDTRMNSYYTNWDYQDIEKEIKQQLNKKFIY